MFMQRTVKKNLLVYVYIISCAQLCWATPQDQLKKINDKINVLKTSLSKEKKSRDKAYSNFKKTEKYSRQAWNRFKKTSTQIQKILLSLKELKKNHQKLTNESIKQHQKLTRELGVTYKYQRSLNVNLPFGDSENEAGIRYATYHRYIYIKNIQRVEKINRHLLAVKKNQRYLITRNKTLKKIRDQQVILHQKYETSNRFKQKKIQSMNASIVLETHQLQQLRFNKKTLEKALVKITKQGLSTVYTEHFSQFKGHLPWPTNGKVIVKFGSKINHSQLRWEGVLIRAKVNQPIYAVQAGKVAFAKWLPGYGLLLIIQHGHGYMTLYGRNHQLFKKPGDMVRKGDLIATVGQSGDYSKPALYFAIRHNAEPLNPLSWCNRNYTVNHS